MVGAALCVVWGHSVDNAVFIEERKRVCTRCGVPCLGDRSGVVLRVGHTLSCFLRHHTYERVGERNGHTEYACVRCGHPLLFRTGDDPYANRGRFAKRVRYLCGLFGHRVHPVVERDGGTEYACHCGHSFVHRRRCESVVRHPLACVLLGHWIAFVRTRARYSEYACRRCGHPFLFASARFR
jgi:DNA-directed RNA polymerase subunit RPC12/RpoP